MGFFFLVWASCGKNSCGPFERIDHRADVPFTISPIQDVFSIGDTITVSMHLDSYYSETTGEYYDIEAQDFSGFDLRILDLEKRREEYVKVQNALLDFDYWGDSITVFRYSTGSASLLFRWAYNKDTKEASTQIKLISKKPSTYLLLIEWVGFGEELKIDWEPGCREVYRLYSPINDSPAERNVHIIAGDTTWMKNIFGEAGYRQFGKGEGILALEKFYYFTVGE